MEIIAIIALTIIIITEKYYHRVERREMLDRLMSRNLVEFKDNVKQEKNEFGEDSTEVEILDVNNDDIEKING